MPPLSRPENEPIDRTVGSRRSPRPVLIIGPTASGKSALALALSRRLGGALIINADALQVYDGWRILTARPGPQELAEVEHALYGHVPPEEPGYSAGAWLREVAPLLEGASADGRPTILVGGAGLYFKVLTEGLAPIPAIAPAQRARIEAEIAGGGLSAAAARLSRDDPKSAARVDLDNPRRVLRALEVLDGTGKGLADWAEETPPPLLPIEAAATARLAIDRVSLRERIRTRLRAMIAMGALDEVAAMTARGLDRALPAMKALGAKELAAHLDGETSLETALEAAAIETGRYAKRQDTWARNQCGAWRLFDWGAAPEAGVEKAAEELARAALGAAPQT